MFQFSEGDSVALVEDYRSLGLSAGDVGVIWVSYSTTPPAYDVTFRGADGRQFDMVLEEHELTVPTVVGELVVSGQGRR